MEFTVSGRKRPMASSDHRPSKRLTVRHHTQETCITFTCFGNHSDEYMPYMTYLGVDSCRVDPVPHDAVHYNVTIVIKPGEMQPYMLKHLAFVMLRWSTGVNACTEQVKSLIDMMANTPLQHQAVHSSLITITCCS